MPRAAAGLSQTRRQKPVHFCLSAQVAEPLARSRRGRYSYRRESRPKLLCSRLSRRFPAADFLSVQMVADVLPPSLPRTMPWRATRPAGRIGWISPWRRYDERARQHTAPTAADHRSDGEGSRNRAGGSAAGPAAESAKAGASALPAGKSAGGAMPYVIGARRRRDPGGGDCCRHLDWRAWFRCARLRRTRRRPPRKPAQSDSALTDEISSRLEKIQEALKTPRADSALVNRHRGGGSPNQGARRSARCAGPPRR